MRNPTETRPGRLTRRGALSLGAKVAGAVAGRAVAEATGFTSFLRPAVVRGQEVVPPVPEVGAVGSKVIFSEENPQSFENPKTTYNSETFAGGKLRVNGALQIDFTFTVNSAGGINLTNGMWGQEERRVEVGYKNGQLHLGYWENNAWRPFAPLQPGSMYRPLQGNPDSTIRSYLKIGEDEQTMAILLPDGSEYPFTIPNSILADPPNNDGSNAEIRFNLPPSEKVTVTNLSISGDFTDLSPIPQPPEPQPVIPEQQPETLRDRFQFPDFSHPIEAKVGNIDADGFEIINMGKTKGLFVTDMDYARAAIQKHFGESGKKLRIIYYVKSSDIPKNLNVNEPGLVRAFPRNDYDDWVEIGNLLQTYSRLLEDNGIITLHLAYNNDLATTVPAYSKLAGNHDVFLQEVVSRNTSLWLTGLMRLYSKYLPPIQTNKPFSESGFEEELNFFSKPIIVATQRT